MKLHRSICTSAPSVEASVKLLRSTCMSPIVAPVAVITPVASAPMKLPSSTRKQTDSVGLHNIRQILPTEKKKRKKVKTIRLGKLLASITDINLTGSKMTTQGDASQAS